jgi:hypothetical protein
MAELLAKISLDDVIRYFVYLMEFRMLLIDRLSRQ